MLKHLQRLHNERNLFFCLRGVNTLEFLYFLWLLFSKHHCHNPGFICLTWKHRVAFIGKSHSLSDIVVCPRLKWTLGQGLNNARACSPLHKKAFEATHIENCLEIHVPTIAPHFKHLGNGFLQHSIQIPLWAIPMMSTWHRFQLRQHEHTMCLVQDTQGLTVNVNVSQSLEVMYINRKSSLYCTWWKLLPQDVMHAQAVQGCPPIRLWSICTYTFESVTLGSDNSCDSLLK